MINKIKYQNPNFRRKLNEARGYRRPIKKIPETKMGVFLSFLYLDTLMGKIFYFTGLLLLIYLVYAPNFLTIKNIKIKGANGENKTSVEKTIREYMSSRAFLPKNNFLIISQKKLSEHLISKNLLVEKVIKIEKDFPNQLIVEIRERFDKFLLKSSGNFYIVSNDGLIKKQIRLEDLKLPSALYSNLIPLNLTENVNFYENQEAGEAGYFENLNEILKKNQDLLQNPITEISIESFNRPDLEAKTELGFVIKFDIYSDLDKIFQQLKLLQKEVGEARISGVKYMDMRIKGRGYVCYKDAACANEETVIIDSATSTNQGLKFND